MNEYDYLAKAKKNMEKERYHEVITLCDEALKINENLPEAYSFKGNAEYELGKYGNAVNTFSKAIEKDPNDAEHYYDRSWAYRCMNMLEDSIVDINKALEISQLSLFYYDKGRFEYWAGRCKEAIEDLTKGIKLKPTESKYVMRGNCYMELDEFDLALSDFCSALEYNPESEWAYYRRGLVYKILDQLEKAEKDFKKAVELCPKHDDAMIELGFIRIQFGKKDAMKYFNKAIKAFPCAENYCIRVKARQKIAEREYFLKNLSSENFTESNYDENKVFNEKQAQDDIKDLSKALALEPDNDKYLRMRALRYEFLDQHENAIADNEALMELEPENSVWKLTNAYLKYIAGKHQETIDDFDEYLQMDDSKADDFLYLTRGDSNFALGNLQEALNDYTKGLALNETAKLYWSRGFVNYKLKHFIQSYKDFKKALDTDSEIESKSDYKMPNLMKTFFRIKKSSSAPVGLSQIEINN